MSLSNVQSLHALFLSFLSKFAVLVIHSTKLQHHTAQEHMSSSHCDLYLYLTYLTCTEYVYVRESHFLLSSPHPKNLAVQILNFACDVNICLALA